MEAQLKLQKEKNDKMQKEMAPSLTQPLKIEAGNGNGQDLSRRGNEFKGEAGGGRTKDERFAI